MSDLQAQATDPALQFDFKTAVAQPQSAVKPKSPAPFSLRLSFDERATLERAAAGIPLGAYIRKKLFDSDLTPRRTRGQHPVKDHTALAHVLGALGSSRLPSNLNQIAKAAHIGALPVAPELETELQEACLQIREIRTDLLRALGHTQVSS